MCELSLKSVKSTRMDIANMISVLIVDDAAFSRRMIRKYLQADGYEVLEATNGLEGLEITSDRQPDCILTDLLMPEMDGFEFLAILREKGLTIPTAIISADIQDTSRQRGIELGASTFLNKPPKQDELRQAVQQLLDSNRCKA
jgi:CheY-like chemotaxis protein